MYVAYIQGVFGQEERRCLFSVFITFEWKGESGNVVLFKVVIQVKSIKSGNDVSLLRKGFETKVDQKRK